MKKTLSILSMVVLIMSLVACGNGNSTTEKAENNSANKTENTATETTEAADDKVAQIKESGKIVLGTNAEYPPFEFHNIDGGNDEIVGVDIEIAKAVAQSLGVELEIKDMAFDGLIAALNVGEMDFVLAGMAGTEERAKVVDFSKPYSEQGQVLLVRAEDAEKYTSVEDLKGIKIGTQLGSTQEAYAKENFVDSEVTAIQDNNNIVMELKNTTYDAVFMAKTPAEKFASLQEGLAVVDIGAPNEPGYSVAVQKGNTTLVDEINAVIDQLNAEGKIQAWIEEYSAEAGE